MGTDVPLVPESYLISLEDSNKKELVDVRTWIKSAINVAFEFSPSIDGDYSCRLFWRGQSRCWGLAPGLHRGIRDTRSWARGQSEFSDEAVANHVGELISRARALGIVPGSLTPASDLHLLAFLQHQGAATPLVDFTSDFLTALAMVCFDQSQNDEDGVLFCYNYKPCNANWVPPFSNNGARALFERLEQSGPGQVLLFSPPYLTPRQRIQRGVFFLSSIQADNPCSTMKIPFASKDDQIWNISSNEPADGDVKTLSIPEGKCVAIKVPKMLKSELQVWLRIHHQLEEDYVYPEPVSIDAHREFLRAASARNLITGGRLSTW